MKNKIYYTKPSITETEIAKVTEAVASGWGEKCYDFLNQFENEFAKFVGVKHAIATSSCTGALHMGLAALDLEEGDEVILADTNWIATVAPLMHLKCKPVFVDINPDTWCLDPEKVKEKINSKTKAIIAVHLYGSLCEMDRLLEISEEHGIPIIEDAAEAIGSYWRGRHAGSMGIFGAFSFHGTKTLTTGEGGMFVTNDSNLYERVLTLSNHGRSRKQIKQFWPDEIGFKYKMSNIQAALGCAQLERIQELIDRKREIFYEYKKHLGSYKDIKLNAELDHAKSCYWMPTAVFSKKTNVTREKLIERFRESNVDARVFFWPLSELPFLGGESQCVNSKDIASRAINLPSYHEISSNDILRVSNILTSFLD